MNANELRELKRKREQALAKLQSGEKLPEHDFSSIPKWDMLIHKIIAEMLGFRLRNRITQDELAKRMGVKQSVISRYEHAGRNPSIEFLYKVADALGQKLFVTPFGDRTVVLTTEQKKILDKYTSEDKPDYVSLLNHIINEYDGRNSWSLTIPTPRNEEEQINIQYEPKKQKEYTPQGIAAVAYA